jgi:hypothetical protein
MTTLNSPRRPAPKPQSTDSVIIKFVAGLIGEIVKDCAAAWLLMSGLDRFDINAPFVGCLLLVGAVSTVLNSAVGMGTRR